MSDDFFSDYADVSVRNKPAKLNCPASIRILPSTTDKKKEMFFKVSKYWVKRTGKKNMPAIDNFETFGTPSTFREYLTKMRRDPLSSAFISEHFPYPRVTYLCNAVVIVKGQKPTESCVFEFPKSILDGISAEVKARPEEQFFDLKTGKVLIVSHVAGTSGLSVRYDVRSGSTVALPETIMETAQNLSKFYAPMDEEYTRKVIDEIELAFETHLKSLDITRNKPASAPKSKTSSANDQFRNNELVSDELREKLLEEDNEELPF